MSRRQAVCDVTVFLVSSGTYVAASVAGARIRWIVAGVAIVLSLYALLVLRHRGETWRDCGLRRDNLWAAGWRTGAWTLVAAAGLLAWGALRGETFWRADVGLLALLYPAWGVAQQLIFQGILHRRLLLLVGARWLALLLTATCFALIHIGVAPRDLPLAALAFTAGLVWSWLFQRWPNVWVLGVSHGLLAALAYPLVLAENPLGRM